MGDFVIYADDGTAIQRYKIGVDGGWKKAADKWYRDNPDGEGAKLEVVNASSVKAVKLTRSIEEVGAKPRQRRERPAQEADNGGVDPEKQARSPFGRRQQEPGDHDPTNDGDPED